jgi:hypothetical protein
VLAAGRNRRSQEGHLRAPVLKGSKICRVSFPNAGSSTNGRANAGHELFFFDTRGGCTTHNA